MESSWIDQIDLKDLGIGLAICFGLLVAAVMSVRWILRLIARTRHKRSLGPPPRRLSVLWPLSLVLGIALLAFGSIDFGPPSTRHVLTMHHDGEAVLTAQAGNTDKVWIYRDSRLIGVIRGHAAIVTHAEFLGPTRIKTRDRSGRAVLTDIEHLSTMPLLDHHVRPIGWLHRTVASPAFDYLQMVFEVVIGAPTAPGDINA